MQQESLKMGKVSLIRKIRKRQIRFAVYIMRKIGSENLLLAGYIEGKRDRDVIGQPTRRGKVNGWRNEFM